MPLMVPSIAVMPREGSFALAVFGRTRKVQESPFSFSARRKSFALKRIELFVICPVSLIGLRFFGRYVFRSLIKLSYTSQWQLDQTSHIEHSFVGFMAG